MSKHDEAVQAFERGELADALRLFEELLGKEESSELWNDWATVQAASGNTDQAETGLLRALEIDPGNQPARADLGILLLGQGKQARGAKLIQESLPFLQPEQQQMLGNALESLGLQTRQVLVISDELPRFSADEPESPLVQLLRGLKELGHRITFISRQKADKEKISAELASEVYAGDGERLPSFGVQSVKADWSLQQILADNDFQLAVLTQSFRGISIPEHYLDAIRRHSPRTRIAIFSEDMHAGGAAARAQISGQLRHLELAEDWAQRELEAFLRGDLAMVTHHRAAESLRYRQIPAVTIPYAFKTPASTAEPRGKGLLFTGNLAQIGPREGLAWFLESVWPLIHERLPEVELRICGASVLPKELQPKLPKVKWLSANQLKQLAPTSRAFAAAERYGARNLFIPAMLALGLPGVTTRFAADANDIGLGQGILTTDSGDDFAASVVQLFEEDELCQRLSGEAIEAAKGGSRENLNEQILSALALAASITPKPAAREPFSMMLVDALYSQLLEQTGGEQRVYARLDFYVQLSEQLLRHGRFAMAREQLRHIFGWLGDAVKLAPPLAQPLGLLKRCYRNLGEDDLAERCAEEARHCFTHRNLSVASVPALARKKGEPAISLIVPTYNRLPILKKCLAALEAQTISKQDFEVIVIDDGSSDGTEEFMQQYNAPFRLHSLRQKNSGTGTARRHGVEYAGAEYLLLMNDDTICDPDVIEQHLAAQQRYSAHKWAVLGNFEYPAESRRRAMTHFFCVNPFMFPQVEMEEGCPYGYSHFITCNLSIKRDAVLQVGSFDGTYMLSEDTEMGIKLFELGYSVVYHRAAHAWHDHAQYAVPNLIRRARIYGADYFYMFRNHPRVMKEWAMPVKLTAMDQENAWRIRSYVDLHREQVKAAAEALARWDTIEFEPILANKESTTHVLSLFQQSVPAVHWFYLFERMLEVMAQEFKLPELLSARPLAMEAAAR